MAAYVHSAESASSVAQCGASVGGALRVGRPSTTLRLKRGTVAIWTSSLSAGRLRAHPCRPRGMMMMMRFSGPTPLGYATCGEETAVAPTLPLQHLPPSRLDWGPSVLPLGP